MIRYKKIFLAIFLLFIITFSFSPSLKNGFIYWDDYSVVVDNYLIKQINLDGVRNIFTAFCNGNYFPLNLLTFAIEYNFVKDNPETYHITNLIFHMLNSLLVFYLIILLTENKYISLITTVLFSIHPMKVESVAWISERKDVLYSFFYLLSIIVYIRFLDKRRMGLIIISFLCFFLSLLSKSMALTLPFVLILIDYYFDNKILFNKIIQKIPFILFAILFGIIAIVSQQEAMRYNYNYGFLDNIFVATKNILFYLQKLFVPINLSALYPYPEKINGFLPLSFYFSFLFVFLFVILLSKLKYIDNKIRFGIYFYLITIFPVLQLIPVGQAIAADRYTYLPSIGIFLIFAKGIWWLYERQNKMRRFILIVVVVGIVIVFSLLTYERCKVWKDSITLWDDVIKKYPENISAYTYRGHAYLKMKDYNNSFKDLNMAIKINTTAIPAYYNRAIAYLETGQILEAEKDLKYVLINSANFVEAYFILGNLYAKEKKYDEALLNYNIALEKKPLFFNALFNRGKLFILIKDYNHAILDLKRAVMINPDNENAKMYLSTAYNEAIIHFKNILNRNSKDVGAYNNLGNIYLALEDYNEALTFFNEAIYIDQKFPVSYYNRAAVYFKLKKYNEALNDLNISSKLGYRVDEKLLTTIKKHVK